MLKVVQLDISFPYHNELLTIHPALIIYQNELTLVDTGYPDFMPLIEREIEEQGYSLDHLKNIIVTHYDDDHIGSLYDFKAKYPHITIVSSEIEKKYIEGKAKSERLVQAENMLDQLPEEQKEVGLGFINTLKSLKHVTIDLAVKNGDRLLGSECEVISTPGHTSGHISLYFPRLKVMITGDAAVAEDNELEIANPHFCLDMKSAQHSLAKLKEMDAEAYYCYHGGKVKKRI